MPKTATLTLTRAELELLRRPVNKLWHHWLRLSGLQKWRDAKEKDRVLTYEHITGQLLDKVLEGLKQVGNG